MAITYMQRRKSGIYEFRKMLPRSLAGRPAPAHVREALPELINPRSGHFKRELTVSLKTSDPKEGARRDMREAVRVTHLFDTAERLIQAGPAPREHAVLDAEALEASVYAEILAADEAEREDGDFRRQLQTPEERAQWPDLVPIRAAGEFGMEEDHFLVVGEHIEKQAKDYRDALAKRDPKIVLATLKGYLRANRIALKEGTPEFHKAGMVVLQAHVRAYDDLRRRHGGDDVRTPPPPEKAPSGGVRLSAAYDAWKAGSGAKGSRKPSDRTILEADHVVRRCVELHGNIPLAQISREKARAFRDALVKLPTHLPAKLRKLPIQKILAHRDAAKCPAPSVTTVNKALNILSAIISHAEREGLLDDVPAFSNPWKGIKLAVDDRQTNGREIFAPDDLKKLFSTPVYLAHERPAGGSGEASFWLPLIALLTGARQGELAQLRIVDLAEDPELGIWYLDIGTTGGRSIKTASSRRKVPLHPVLEAIGLLRYRQSLLEAGSKADAPLWPGITSDSVGRKAGPWSKWFNRYLRDVAGIEEPSKVFHSFRHTFKRMARDANLTQELHNCLTGHAGTDVGSGYGAGFGLKALHDGICRIEAPPVIVPLRWEPGAGRGARVRLARKARRVS